LLSNCRDDVVPSGAKCSGVVPGWLRWGYGLQPTAKRDRLL
jgi:hypothetical protein